MEQKKIFELLNCPKKIGVTLTEGLMMVPTKSVTAIIGLARDSENIGGNAIFVLIGIVLTERNSNGFKGTVRQKNIVL
ncbi:MAG: hypothetical protein LUD41_00780 [Phascolarctobacterium sp.]|nr:hypothetical protein [Phascolarctobacterium sp.]